MEIEPFTLTQLKAAIAGISDPVILKVVENAVNADIKVKKAKELVNKVLFERADERDKFIEAYRLRYQNTHKRDLSGWLAPGSTEQGAVHFENYLAKKALLEATEKVIEFKKKDISSSAVGGAGAPKTRKWEK